MHGVGRALVLGAAAGLAKGGVAEWLLPAGLAGCCLLFVFASAAAIFDEYGDK